ERVLVVGKRELAAGEARDPLLDLAGIEVPEIDEQRLALRRAQIGPLLHHGQLRLDAGNPRALVEDAPVADHDDPAAGADVVLHHELCGQFRADASGISHCQCNERLCGHMITFSRAVSRAVFWTVVSWIDGAGLRSKRASCSTSGSSNSTM